MRGQATTVSALTIIKTDFQSAHARRSATQKTLSAGVSFSHLGPQYNVFQPELC
jgi:hypothetical protein